MTPEQRAKLVRTVSMVLQSVDKCNLSYHLFMVVELQELTEVVDPEKVDYDELSKIIVSYMEDGRCGGDCMC